MKFFGWTLTKQQNSNYKDVILSLFSNNYSQNTYETRTVEGQAKAYMHCEPVSTVINRLAQGLTNAAWLVKNEKGELPANYDSKGYKKLFTVPNPFQNFNEFIVMAEACRLVFGEAFILPIRPVGFSDKYTNYYVLPNTFLTINYNTDKSILYMNSISDYYKSITLCLNGESININPSDLIIIRDSHANLIESNKLSSSRLYTLKDQISNIVSAYESRGVLIKNRGAAGIISPKGSNTMMPMVSKDKEEIEGRLQDRYGLLANQFRYIVSSSGIDYTPLEMKVGDLKLFEEVEADTISIAEAYNYPPQLLGISKTQTYNNVSEAKKSMYENAIIPAAYTWAYSFENYFKRDITNTNTIDVDFSDLEIFQKSQKEKAEEFEITRATYTKMFQDGIITQNQLFLSLGQQPIADGDKYINDIDDIPPAIKLGVGGLQALQGILIDQTMTARQKENVLKIIFKFSENDSKLLANQ